MKTLLSIFLLCLLITPAHSTDYIEQVVIPNKSIVYDSAAFLGLKGYYSTANLVQSQLNEEKLSNIDEKLSQLIQLLTEVSQKLNGNTSNPPNNPNDDNANNNNGGDSPNDSEGEETENNGEGGAAASELDIAVYELFSTKCVTCHGKPDSDGGLRLIDKDNQSLFFQDLPHRVEIFIRTNRVGLDELGKKGMPPTGPLSDEEVSLLRKWMVELADKQREKSTDNK